MDFLFRGLALKAIALLSFPVIAAPVACPLELTEKGNSFFGRSFASSFNSAYSAEETYQRVYDAIADEGLVITAADSKTLRISAEESAINNKSAKMPLHARVDVDGVSAIVTLNFATKPLQLTDSDLVLQGFCRISSKTTKWLHQE